MSELEDLCGRTFFWTLRRQRPLLCAIYEGASIVGTLEGYRHERTLRARFAGLDWSLSHTGWFLGIDCVAFADGDTVAIGGGSVGGYEIEIDRTYRYGLSRGAHHGEWRDAASEVGVEFRKSSEGSFGTDGEAHVTSKADAAHAPILLLVGILQASRRRLFDGRAGLKPISSSRPF